jgi:hypothetical protein
MADRRQVGGQGVQVAEGPGRIGPLGPLGQLLGGEAAFDVVLAERLDELLAVGVGGAQRRPPPVRWSRSMACSFDRATRPF